MRIVKVGRSIGKRTVIESGVQPGENVVTDGHLRLFPGAQVTLVEAGKTEAGKS
jgi:multidrug efflux system membrane fusion protein